MSRFLLLFCGVFWSLSAAAVPYSTAVLQGVDKITGRIRTMEVPLGSTQKFGKLTITAMACDKTRPEETPEKSVFLEVFEQKSAAKEPVEVFKGWMFASSPAISALEHPIYDIWVIDCINQPSGSGSL